MYVRLYLHCKSVLKSQYLLTYVTSELPQTRGLPVYRIFVNILKEILCDAQNFSRYEIPGTDDILTCLGADAMAKVYI
jgi:hypothetical protein